MGVCSGYVGNEWSKFKFSMQAKKKERMEEQAV